MELLASETAPDVALLVKAGLSDQQSVPIRVGQTLTVVLEVFASARGCKVEELIVVREGEAEPLSALIVLDEHYPRHRRHHVHHKHDVLVKVFYQAGAHERSFKRQETVDHVLDWAARAFSIDPTMAAEFGLARHGDAAAITASEHIGHVAGHHHHAIELDLVRGPIANGAS